MMRRKAQSKFPDLRIRSGLGSGAAHCYATLSSCLFDNLLIYKYC
jgi:hypothetical protein